MIHPMIEPILRETFGVIIYQEQVMQIAQALVGLFARRSRHAAPRDGQEDQEGDGRAARALRRRARSSAALTKAKADEIFDLLRQIRRLRLQQVPCGAYALIAYQTAWFKANHPAEFLAASMTLDKGNTDKLAEFRAEAERLGIKVAPPSANASGVDFDVRPGADAASDDPSMR